MADYWDPKTKSWVRKGARAGESFAEDPAKKKEEEEWAEFERETGVKRGLGSAAKFVEWKKKKAAKEGQIAAIAAQKK